MYLLQCIQKAQDKSAGVNVEYRLACSGELYNRKVETFDWRKSDATRILLTHPFPIFVVSRPFDAYPQELCVRVNLNTVTEEGGSSSARFSRTFLPDADVIEDLCAVLTLLSRRLISPFAKTREKHPDELSARWYQSEIPMPVIQRSEIIAWPRRPATIITSATGQEFKSNDPPPVGINPDALTAFLMRLPTIPNVQEVVYAARLYKLALELIVDRPDTAYLMLVSVVECLANIALEEFEPNEAEKLESKAHIIKRAREFGLDEQQAKLLALEASKGDRWLTKRFVKFCTDYCSLAELSKPDNVFMVLDHLTPPASEFANVLSRIYRARSKNLHVASPFPPGIGIGMGPEIKIRDLPLDPLGRPDIPPVAWFERVVSIAARKYLLPTGPKPFLDASESD
jgi:hypothetical protein